MAVSGKRLLTRLVMTLVTKLTSMPKVGRPLIVTIAVEVGLPCKRLPVVETLVVRIGLTPIIMAIK